MKFNIFLIWAFVSVNSLIAQPIINSVSENNNSIEQYGKLELTVDLTATYTNTYDFSQVNLQAIFISPSGEKILLMGFICKTIILQTKQRVL